MGRASDARALSLPAAAADFTPNMAMSVPQPPVAGVGRDLASPEPGPI